MACPTLIVHGAAYTSVPPAQSERARDRVRGSQVHWVQDGERIGFLLDEEGQTEQRITEWLRLNTRQSEP